MNYNLKCKVRTWVISALGFAPCLVTSKTTGAQCTCARKNKRRVDVALIFTPISSFLFFLVIIIVG